MEASKLIQELINQYQEPLIRGRIYISAAQLYCSSGDFQKALQTLKSISTEYSADHFIRSRQMMAAIHLTKLKDRKRFTDCYR